MANRILSEKLERLRYGEISKIFVQKEINYSIVIDQDEGDFVILNGSNVIDRSGNIRNVFLFLRNGITKIEIIYQGSSIPTKVYPILRDLDPFGDSESDNEVEPDQDIQDIPFDNEINDMDIDVNINPPKNPKRLPMRSFDPKKPLYFEQDCPVCLESFKKNDRYCSLNCGHVFHCDCINDLWNTGVNTTVEGYYIEGFQDKCPMCNTKIEYFSKVPVNTIKPNKFGSGKPSYRELVKMIDKYYNTPKSYSDLIKAIKTDNFNKVVKEIKSKALRFKFGNGHCENYGIGQISGTCWFNSVINSLLLGEYSRKLLIDNLKKYLEKNNIDISYDSCPLMNKHGLYQIIYNSLILNDKPNISNSSKLEKAQRQHKIFASSNPFSKSEPKIEGGYQIDAFEHILKILDISFRVKECKNYTCLPKIKNESKPDILIFNGCWMENLEEINLQRIKYKDKPERLLKMDSCTSKLIIPETLNEYKLNSIGVSMKGGNGSGAHAINIFYCGGKFYLSDANADNSFLLKITKEELTMFNLYNAILDCYSKNRIYEKESMQYLYKNPKDNYYPFEFLFIFIKV